jgi:hypothetical protein
MELRLDRLLSRLRVEPEEILGRIDGDPLLVKRQSGSLVLANASQLLFTPQEEHQLYAKGIVYRRDPYEVVSLPLIKIYNVGERGVTLAELSELGAEGETRLRFLRKFDGSLVQVFRAEGRVWFTTRGMLEGAPGPRGEDPDVPPVPFDFLARARALARERYPVLLEQPSLLEGRTLVFEFLHPEARKVTNYGDRADLILLTAYDQAGFRYLSHAEVADLGHGHGLTVVDALDPAGEDLPGQVDHLLASWAGTDEEGCVLSFEREGEVIYRVKVKSPDYLQLLRLMVTCSYERTAEILDANPPLASWPEFEAYLQAQGNEKVPEEVLAFYREHLERYQAYLQDCERIMRWAEETCKELGARVRVQDSHPKAFRKAFAALATQSAYSGLLFAALDGRLTLARARQTLRTPEDARDAVRQLSETREESESEKPVLPP